MEQQQFRVSFSLGTKLLLSIVTLLLIVIGFLTVSTIIVLTDDKRAYTFQAQGTETLLAGREFVNLNSRALSSLRLLMSSFDPSRALSPTDRRVMQSVLDNQSDIVFVEAGRLSADGTALEPLGTVFQEEALAKIGQKPGDFALAREWFPIAAPGLRKSSVYFVNTSRPGQPSQAILFADTRYRSPDGSLPVVIGFMPIRDFSKEFRGSRITMVVQELTCSSPVIVRHSPSQSG